MNRRVLLLLSCIVLLGCSTALAREFRIAASELPPYLATSMPGGGVLAEIVTMAFEREGHRAVVEFFPWARAVSMMKNGQVDGLVGYYDDDPGLDDLERSQPIYTSYIGIVALKGLGLNKYRTLDDLRKYSIGVSHGYFHGAEFENASYLAKDTAPSPAHNFMKLVSKRIDLMATPFDVFKKLLAEYDAQNSLSIVYVYPPLNRSSFYLMSNRTRSVSVGMMHIFDSGLIKIKSDGTYNKILIKHGL